MPTRTVPTKFSVAFSLAGEQREQVLPVVQEVEDILGRSTVFYDTWYEHWIAGPDADLLLQRIYGQDSELVVVILSGCYSGKPWTQTEHRAIRARLMEAQTADARRRILPLRAGDGEVEGILFNEIVPDLREKTVRECAELIVARLNLVRESAIGPPSAVPHWPNQPPDLHWPMADHGEARNALAEFLCDSSLVRALMIRGASETGKSHMSKQMTGNVLALPGVICGRFDFKGTTSMDVEVEAFSQSLGVEPPTGRTLNERLGRILAILRGFARPTVLIFDTYEAAGEAGDWIERVLLPHLVKAPWLRVIITGQSVPNRLGTTWELMAPRTLVLQAPGPNEWLEYGRAHRDERVDIAFVTRAHQYADGKASILAGLLGPRA